MNIYTCTSFTGHWPVGTAAVVVASNRKAAVKALEAALAERSLKQIIDPEDLSLLSTHHQQVLVLNDGNY